MKKTKILFIIPSLSIGGTTIALTSMLNYGLADAYDIDVFVIKRQGCILPSIALHDIGMNGLTTAYYGDFSRFRTKDKVKYLIVKLLKQNHGISSKLEELIIRETVRRIERKKQYNVIIGFQEGLATRVASYFSGPRKIAWIHCDYANTYGEKTDELALYNVFDTVVCVSQFTRRGFVGRYPALTNKTVAIHNVFDTQSVIERSMAMIDDAQFDTSHFTIISLGRVHEVKRFYMIPEIAVQLKKAGLDFRWYILGSAGIPSELQRLTDAIKRNDINENVIYLGEKSNPYPFLKAADVLVTVSKSEACPMIFNEAKILRVPIVSAHFGSAYELLEDGETGIITPLEGIPNAIMRMYSDELLREQIKANMIRFNYDNRKILEAIKRIL